MKIDPSEISSVEEIGNLYDNPVKLIRLKGGYHVVTGKEKGKNKENVLAAGSHPAIVKFSLEKQYKNDFKPLLAKSESLSPTPIVTSHSKFLPEDLIKSGHDIYSIQSGQNIEFQITKHDMKIYNTKGTIQNDTLVLSEVNISKEFSSPLSKALSEQLLSFGAKKVEIKKG